MTRRSVETIKDDKEAEHIVDVKAKKETDHPDLMKSLFVTIFCVCTISLKMY